MENLDRRRDSGRTLNALLKEAGLKSFGLDAGRRGVFYAGRSREWLIVAHVRDGWLNAYTTFCDLPLEGARRMRALELALSLGGGMLVTKFVTAPSLLLELDYRWEHVESRTLRELIGTLQANAEEHFPKIFRILNDADEAAPSGKPENATSA